MKTNYFYFAVTREQCGKFYSYLVRATSSTNLLNILGVGDIVSANIYRTKKEAAETVHHWNATHRANNKYLYSDTF